MRLHIIIIQQKFNFSKRFQKVNDFMQKSDETGFFFWYTNIWKDTLTTQGLFERSL